MTNLNRRIQSETSPARKAILKKIRDKFALIHEQDYGIVKDHRLYFFQKYTIHAALEARRRKEPGIIVANEQGLGKTITALALAASQDTTIIAPNADGTT